MIILRGKHPQIKSWEEGNAFHLDVRKLLEEGGEPYAYIMECLHQLKPGGVLAVHALFEPQPMMLQAERLGYQTESRRVGPDHWVVEFQTQD